MRLRRVAASVALVLAGLGGLGMLTADAASPAGFTAVVNPLTHVPATGQALWGVSCPAADDCVAVGGGTQPFVLAGDPSNWSAAQAQPIDFGKPFGLLNTSLWSVACTSSSWCVAIGSDAKSQIRVITGDPSTWSAAQPRTITLGRAFGRNTFGWNALYGVTCVSSSLCVAVGSDVRGEPLVLAGDPATWTAKQAREISLPFSGGILDSVSCTSVTSCVAVGSGEQDQPLVLAGNPSTWTAAQAYEIDLCLDCGSDVGLASVSCPSASFCVAVGGGPDGQPLVFAGDPVHWVAAQANEIPLGPELGSGGSLDSVSCTSSSACFAAGSDDRNEPLTFAGNPSTWDSSAAREIALGKAFGGTGELLSISCATASACVATGDDSSQPLVLAGDPSTWGAAEAQEITLKGLPFGLVSHRSTLTCVSATSCLDLGHAGQDTEYLIQADPATWDQASTVQLTGIPVFTVLYDAACPAPTYCVAVGSGGGRGEPFVLVGDPSTWGTAKGHLISLSAKLGFNGVLSSVACSSTTSCVAVGRDGYDEPLVFTGDPAAWTRSQAKEITLGNRHALGGGNLTSVACLSSAACVAVGSDFHRRPIVLTGKPSDWRGASVREIKLSARGSLDSVACTSRTRCVGVGSAGKAAAPLVFVGNPARWTAKSAFGLAVPRATATTVKGFALRTLTRSGFLTSISCETATYCVAVGGDDRLAPLYIAGNPKTWRGRRLVRPAADGASFATAVLRTTSCTPVACFAGGFANGGDFVASWGGG